MAEPPDDTGYQTIQALVRARLGRRSRAPGSGSAARSRIPNASTDFMFAAIGEELGLVGTIGVVAAFMLFVGSAFRIAIDADRPFTKLFAAGLATIIGLQTFLIIGGVTRVIPLTGITLPFVSYGGSSLVANFALLAILLRISDDTRARRAAAGCAMNTGIRRVGIAIIVLFVGLVAQLTYLQVVDSNKLANDPHNPRKFLADIRRDRGPIVTADGVGRRAVGADQRRVQATSASTRRHRTLFAARRRLPVDPARLGRRRERRTRRSSRAATSSCSCKNLAELVREHSR